MFACLSLALLALATTWTHAAELPKEDPLLDVSYDSPGNRIIGGWPARKGEFPYQVSIILNRADNVWCGGSLITTKHVLTAAHCVFQMRPSVVGVVAGQLTEPITENTVFRQASFITVHERYDDLHLINDIAIIEVVEAFPTNNPLIRVISLRYGPIHAGACVVTGWGRTQLTEIIGSPVLLVGVVNIVNFRKCQIAYRPLVAKDPSYTITEGMVCAGQGYAPTGSCKGDSGGPLVCDGVLTGIVSKGSYPCTRPEYPGVYTEVARFIPWIENTINNN